MSSQEAKPTQSKLYTRPCPACRRDCQLSDIICVGCGANLLKAWAVESDQKCPTCGHEFRENELFCAQCGLNLFTGQPRKTGWLADGWQGHFWTGVGMVAAVLLVRLLGCTN